jgi:hypothetical protein
VASDAAGMPDFWPLFLRSAKPAELHVWAFDLLALDGKDLRKLPLERRQARLQALVSRFACPTVLPRRSLRTARRCSRWPRSMAWKAWCASAGMRPNRSGVCRGWRKVKTMANRDRWRLIEASGW